MDFNTFVSARRFYQLEGRRVVPSNLATWAATIDGMGGNRVLAWTRIARDVDVSTVFLGVDHRHGATGPPIVFETLVFGGIAHDYMRRYSSYRKAIRGHWRTVRMVRAREAAARKGRQPRRNGCRYGDNIVAWFLRTGRET